MQRIMVDLPEPDGPQITMPFAAADVEVDVAQNVELAEPLVHADHLHGGLGPRVDGGGGRGRQQQSPWGHRFWPAASRRSIAIE
jgi:hypothetical protein